MTARSLHMITFRRLYSVYSPYNNNQSIVHHTETRCHYLLRAAIIGMEGKTFSSSGNEEEKSGLHSTFYNRYESAKNNKLQIVVI
jgi:hypothetical protein